MQRPARPRHRRAGAILQRPWRLPLLAVRLLRRWTTLTRQARRSRRGPAGRRARRLPRPLRRPAGPAALPRRPIVLDHLIGAADTARDRGETGATQAARARRLDRAALGAADVVVVDTEEQRRTLSAATAAKAVVVPVGARRAWFAAAAACGRRPAAGGLLRPLHAAAGHPVIGAALARLADAGRRRGDHGRHRPGARRGPRARRRPPRITWLDWVPGADLPALVAAHDVCLGIFGTTPKALRVVPTKVYQGAAAGCAVVTWDTAPQRRALGAGAVFVPPGDAAALADALVRLADDRDALGRAAAAVVPTPPAATSPPARPWPRSSLCCGPDDRRHRVTPTEPPLSPAAWLRWGRCSPRCPAGAIDVLEVGCGQGGFGVRLARRYPAYVGVEPDRQAFEVAQAPAGRRRRPR